MGSTDEDLLARLNRLRPSPVTLDTNPSIDVTVSQPKTRDDQLSERLKRLRNGEHVGESRASSAAQTITASDLVDTGEPLDTLQDVAHDQIDEDAIARLLAEAQDALPPPADHSGMKVEAGQTPNEDADNAMDEQEADEYVQRVLAELDLESRVDAMSTPDRPGLPSAPEDPEAALPPTYEDSELESRLSKLGLGLPSTPEGKPVSKKARKPEPKPPTFTDEDIDSWCVICNEDGEVRCLGCDNDIYCQSCWSEGHGNGPGREKGHRAVQFVKKGGGLAAAD